MVISVKRFSKASKVRYLRKSKASHPEKYVESTERKDYVKLVEMFTSDRGK